MTEQAHRWVTVKVYALRSPLLHTIRIHRPLDADFMDNVQWRTTDGLHKLNEITAVADYGILIPMEGYRGYTAAAIPPNVLAGLRSASLTERRNAYIPRLKQVSRAAGSLSQARRRNETHHVADPVALYYTTLNQINAQHWLRLEVRGDPVEPVPREPWIMRLLGGMEKSNGRIRGFGVAIYWLAYRLGESEWNAFKDKLEGHIADWGRGQTGSAAIKPYLKLHWMDGRTLGIAEGDVKGARKHFHDHGSSFDAKDHVNKRFFLVVDEPVVASYTGSTYCAATTIPNDGDFTGFVLAVDADYNPAEGIQGLDESPGYHGQMRILENLVWGDLYAMHAAQSALLEDLWPLALDHPNTVYIGPVVPFETRSWRLQNGLRNVCLRAVADYAHERIHGTPFPVAPTRQFTVPGMQTTPNISTPANPRLGPSDDQVRTFMLRAFQRHLRRNNQHREALMVDEMLLTPEGQMPDMERMRRRVELAEMDGPPATPTLSQGEEDELERREFERTFCQQQ